MMRRIVGDVTIECVLGDITRQGDVDAVVNAANANLGPGGGVAGAIHEVAGPGLARECVPLAPIGPGEAVITAGHGLPNPYVIHCLGPVYGTDHPEAELLASCYHNALRLAGGRGLGSVAFPSISTGIFGYPVGKAATVAMRAVMDMTASLAPVKLIRFVLYNQTALAAYEEALAASIL